MDNIQTNTAPGENIVPLLFQGKVINLPKTIRITNHQAFKVLEYALENQKE